MLSALQFFTPQMRPNLKALSKCVQMLCDSVIFTSVVSKYRFFYIPPIKINCFKGSVIYCCSLAHDTKELIPLGFVAIGCYITIINIAFFQRSITVFTEAKKWEESLTYFPLHLLLLLTFVLYWDNEREMVSWPIYRERWWSVIEANSTQKR